VVGEYEGWKSIAEHKPESIELAKHATSLESKLSNEAQALRQPARLTPEGLARESLFRRAHENEATLI
jgi:hypothetical protein